jgi:uncharacterized protein with HEPN domain
MFEAAEKAVSLTAERTRDEVVHDEVLLLALTHLLEIVGEAASNVSANTRERSAEIPWARVVATRNRLVHGYDEVDLTVLWDIIQNDLPLLIAALEPIIASLEE